MYRESWFCCMCRWTVVLVTVGLLGLARSGRAEESVAPAEVYQRLVDAYMAGQWANLAADLRAHVNDFAILPKGQRADLDYIFQTVTQGRPEWWARCKAGKGFHFKSVLWGRALDTEYDPDFHDITMSSQNGGISLIVGWKPEDMDNPELAEHGFTKGELNNLAIWAALGRGRGYAGLPQELLLNSDSHNRLLLARCEDFWGYLSAVYYGTPRARRWGLWLALAAYDQEKDPPSTLMAREALAAALVQEVVSHPTTYPSIQLPGSVPANGVEKTVALHINNWIETHGWTLAEDKALREVFRILAGCNDMMARTGMVTLPNKLLVALDPKVDAFNRPRRDAWLKAKLEQGKPGG